MSKTNTRTIIR